MLQNSNRKRGLSRSGNSGIIDPKEVEAKGGTLPMGKGHWVRKELLTMEVGQMLFVHRSDWNWRGRGNGPSRIVSDLNKSTSRRFTTMLAADGSGWVIERVL